jgi:hypothetical protein
MTLRQKSFFLAVVMLALVAGFAPAAGASTLATGNSYTWQGGVSTSWETLGNWSSTSNGTGYSPNATINTATNYPVINAPETLAAPVGTVPEVGPSGDNFYGLYLSNSASQLTINSTLTITGGANDYSGGVWNAGTITINTGGSLTAPSYGNLNGPMPVSGVFTTGTPGSIVLNGGTLGIAGGTLENGEAISGNGTIAGTFTNYLTHYNVGSNNSPPAGTVTANSAAGLNVTGAFTNGYNFEYAAYNGAALNVGTSISNPTGVMNIQPGGTLTNYGVLSVYGTLNNNTSTAVVLASKGNNTSGSASLQGGTLGGTGTGGFINASGFTFNAYGTIAAPFTNSYTSTSSYGTIVIPSLQTLAIANGITLINNGHLVNNGTLDFIIAGSGTGVSSTGVLQNNAAHSTFTTIGNAEFDLTGLTGQNGGESWEFFLGSSSSHPWAGATTSSPGNVTVVGLASGLTWEIDPVGTTGEVFKIDGTAVAVPIPPSALLLGTGLLGLVGLGWRSKKVFKS